MNTAAYLESHGWLGSGHLLQPNGRGLKKPLTVPKKSNLHGVGKKKVDVHADQWWARAFDSGLKQLDLGTSRSKAGSEQKDSPSEPQLIAKKTSRFMFTGFVQGESLRGTFPSSVWETKNGEGATTLAGGFTESRSEKVADDAAAPEGRDSPAARFEDSSRQVPPSSKKVKKRKSTKTLTIASPKLEDRDELQRRTSLRQGATNEDSNGPQGSTLSLKHVTAMVSTSDLKKVIEPAVAKPTKEGMDSTSREYRKKQKKRKRKQMD